MFFSRFHRTLILGFAVGLIAALSAGASADPGLLAQIKQRGTLRIAMEGTYPPFDYVDKTGKLVGFEVDLADALTKRIGVKPEFITTKWDGILAGLDSGRYDVIMNQVTMTPEREAKYAFSQPYTVSGVQILVRKGEQTKIDKPADLAGKSVGVGLGTEYEKWLRKNVPTANVKTYDDDPTKYQDLRVGRIDAVLNDRLVIGYMVAHSDGQIVAAGAPFAKQDQGIALRKGNPALLSALNSALVDLHKDGTFKRISDKWFGTDVSK
ncbi:MAG: cystine ABC transporter substrate-binding protein [Vulcanimicrobiaceae bacterium]